jgi:hypothetical protein
MRNPTIRDQLEEGQQPGIRETASSINEVFALAEKAEGRPLPRAVLPGIVLQSPKITRKLTTRGSPNGSMSDISAAWPRALKSKRSQPAAAPTVGMHSPVGVAEGCDLLILRQSTFTARPIA